MERRDPRPEILRLEELAIAVRNGAIKLPKFQRSFVWKRQDMIRLLDSIYRGYPIGSLLMWNSSQQLTSERTIDGLNINRELSVSYPVDYLLDGQQRLTTLCGALYWEGGSVDSKWNIHFDLDDEVFTYPDKSSSDVLFPLNKLLNTRDFIKQCMRLEHHPRSKVLIERAERLLRSVKDYKVAVVKIGDMTVEEVAPIFERINSTGRKLTIVDLMVAATWSNNFDLGDAIKAMGRAVTELGFGFVKDQYLLRAISAAAGGGITKDALQALRALPPEQLKAASADAESALISAVKFLRSRLNIMDSSKIPYAMQLNLLVEYFRIAGEGDRQRENELVRWIWFTTVTRYFASANTGQIVRDLSAIRKFARREIQEIYRRDQIDATRFVYDKFSLRNSTTIGFMLLLGAATPDHTVDGIYMGKSYLSGEAKGFYAPLMKGLGQNLAYVINVPGNKIVPEDITHMTDHLIDADCVEAIRIGDAELFVEKRLPKIADLIRDLTECPVVFGRPA